MTVHARLMFSCKICDIANCERKGKFAGLPCVIYLMLNDAVRKEALRMIGRKPAVKISSKVVGAIMFVYDSSIKALAEPK